MKFSSINKKIKNYINIKNLILFILLIIFILLILKLVLKNKNNFYEGFELEQDNFKFYDENNKIIDHLNLERPEQLIVLKYIKPDDVVLELGARYGTVSCTINKILNNKKNQVSVDPDKKIWDSLEKNKQINNCDFHIIKGFISNKNHTLNGDGYGIYSSQTEESDIPSYTLKEIKDMYNLNFNVLVADCEGFLESFFDENPEIYKELKLVIFEADYPERCNYDSIRKKLKENGFNEILNGHQNVWKK